MFPQLIVVVWPKMCRMKKEAKNSWRRKVIGKGHSKMGNSGEFWGDEGVFEQLWKGEVGRKNERLCSVGQIETLENTTK